MRIQQDMCIQRLNTVVDDNSMRGSMMGFKIGFIAPYPELVDLAREVCRELGEEMDVRHGDLSVGTAIAREMESQGIEVIISRGGTALAIQEAVGIPVIPIQVTGFDIVRALHTARQFSDSIGVIGFKNVIYGTESVQEILEVSLKLIYIEHEQDAEAQIEAAVRGGLKVIVGDAISTRVTEMHGAKGILIMSGKEAIAKAIEEAKHVAWVQARERQKAEELKAIVDFAHEGIVAIDRDGVITVFNPVAERLLGISANEALGRHLSELSPKLDLDKVRLSGKSELEIIQRVGENVIMTNRIPIIVRDDIVGVVVTFQDVTRIQKVEQEVRRELYLKGHVAKHKFNDLISAEDNMLEVITRAQRFAATEATVLITGETGTGKELFAHSIHNASSRRGGPFVAVNCAALPESILESELFGYEEGAFTGSRKGGKPGLFELAHGGTVFLDEIGDMSMPLQARLLRVLEQRLVLRLGGDKMIPVDIRVIAATHKDLKKSVRDGTFRQDLYYRLNVLKLEIRPLRERKADIPKLADHFIGSFCKDLGLPRKKLSTQAVKVLMDLPWPGNVRELRNMCERLVVSIEEEKIDAEHVMKLMEHDNGEEQYLASEDTISVPIRGGLQKIEEEIMRQVLEKVSGDRTKAAELLGISRSTLWRRLGSKDVS